MELVVEPQSNRGVVDFVGKEGERRFARAMARVASAASACRWSRGRRTEETLTSALNAAEQALGSVQVPGGILEGARRAALERSGLDGWAAAKCVRHLCESKLSVLAARVVQLADGLDPELAGLPRAVLRFEAEPDAALEDLDALAEDRTRTIRTRLHALWWRRTLAETPSDEGALVGLVGEALEQGDYAGAEQVLHALEAATAEARRAARVERAVPSIRRELTWPFQPAEVEEERAWARGDFS